MPQDLYHRKWLVQGGTCICAEWNLRWTVVPIIITKSLHDALIFTAVRTQEPRKPVGRRSILYILNCHMRIYPAYTL